MLPTLHFLILSLLVFVFALSVWLVIYSLRIKKLWLYIAIPISLGVAFELLGVIVTVINNWPKSHTPLSAAFHNIGVSFIMVGALIGFVIRKKLASH